MKDLLNFVNLTDAERWKKVYPLIRDAYGEHVTSGVSLEQTESFLASHDLHKVREYFSNSRSGEIAYIQFQSRWAKDSFQKDGKNDVDLIRNIVYGREFDHYYDLILILSIISLEEKREERFRKIPIWGASISAAAVIIVAVANLLMGQNTIKEIEKNSNAIIKKMDRIEVRNDSVNQIVVKAILDFQAKKSEQEASKIKD